MERKTGATKGAGPKSRKDRLKSALKANMAKRKAQARARADANETNKAETVETGKDDGHG